IVKKDLTQEDLSTSFWLSVMVRTTIFLVVFFTAPLAAAYWREPKVEPVVRVISFVLFITLIGIIPETLASKNLEFKKINIIRGIAIFFESLTAIVLVAFTHLTYWALVIGMMVNAVFYNFTLWLSTGAWRPKLTFNKESFRYLFRFGVYGWLFSITNYLKQNVDYFLVGRLLGTYKLGLYEFAYRLPHLVFDRISRPVGAVVFPALAKVQDDNEAIFKGYVTAVKYVCLVCYPILFGLIAVADILVPTLWGEQWVPIIRPLQILCVAAALKCLSQPLGGVFCSKNRPDLPFKASVVELLITIIFVLLFGYFFGLLGVALGMLVSVFPSLVVLWFAFIFLLRINFFAFWRELYSVVFSSLICAISACLVKEFLLFSNMSYVFILLLSVLSGAFVYFLIIFLLFKNLARDLFQKFKSILGIKVNFV
ncbi:MAG: lipopolysaccharide biosynthesis protein, partial [Desulfonauticus sp.]|nr:lipopolysaccharide biosynthesis protein [Desulfonauticus sp.]